MAREGLEGEGQRIGGTSSSSSSSSSTQGFPAYSHVEGNDTTLRSYHYQLVSFLLVVVVVVIII